MLDKKSDFEIRNLTAGTPDLLPESISRQLRAKSCSVVFFGQAAQKNNAYLNALQANENEFDARPRPAEPAEALIEATGSAHSSDRYCPTEREARLRLVLLEVEKDYQTGYASFPSGQISGMDWVLDVLEDLAAFSKSRGARNIVSALVRTSVEIERELAAQQTP